MTDTYYSWQTWVTAFPFLNCIRKGKIKHSREMALKEHLLKPTLPIRNGDSFLHKNNEFEGISWKLE